MKKFVTIALSVLMTINLAGCTFGTKPVATPSKDNVAKAETKATLAVEKEEPAEDEKTEEKGVGEKTKATLLKTFRSVKQIKLASLEQLIQSMGKSKAQVVYDFFHQ